MDILSNFRENLTELIFDKKITVEQVSKDTGITLSEVYTYLRRRYLPKLSNIIKIADCYNYSIDFLLGFIQIQPKINYKKTPLFSQTFKALLAERKVTRYRLNKDTKISINCLDSWYNGKSIPSVENAVILARYFDCSLDELLGRE